MSLRAQQITGFRTEDEASNRFQEQVKQALNPLLRELSAPPAWQSLPLAGSWVSNGLLPPGFVKDVLGVVRLRGNVTGGAADLIGTLPDGLRPAARAIFVTDHNGTYGRVNVLKDGTITSDVGANPHVNVSLDGIHFDTRP